jgi:hypothetical protein
LTPILAQHNYLQPGVAACEFPQGVTSSAVQSRGGGMGSDKSRDDEIYERGVHDGQKSTLLDQFSHSLTKGYTLNERENAIYNAGYTYGVDHKSDAKDD